MDYITLQEERAKAWEEGYAKALDRVEAILNAEQQRAVSRTNEALDAFGDDPMYHVARGEESGINKARRLVAEVRNNPM